MAMHWVIRSLVVAILTGLIAVPAFAAGGTSQVTSKGQKLDAQSHWPEGLEKVLNDPARTEGWNPWFTEWPNDVVHYQFDVKNTDDVNRLLELFAQTKSDDLHVHLSVGKEPRGIGWVSSLKEGNGTAMLLSLGDQRRMDQWFAQLGGKKFGVMEFEKVPVAVPPTITIFVQNPAIDLALLKIPAKIHASAGYVPGQFHVTNLKLKLGEGPLPKEIEDPELRKALEAVGEFLTKRKRG